MVLDHGRFLSSEDCSTEYEIICHKSSKRETNDYFGFHTKYQITMNIINKRNRSKRDVSGT
jgi:uncharacterized protein YjbK